MAALCAPILLLPCSQKKQPLLQPSSPPSLSRLGHTHRRRGIVKATTSDPARRSGNYHPTIWDDSYIQTLSVGFTEEDCLIRRNKLEEEVRHLIEKEKGLVEQLELLDNLRQLGLSYHFELEINDALSLQDLVNNFKNKKINYNMNLEHDVKDMLSLYEASYLAVDGEDVLDEAGEFAAKFLDNATKGSSVNKIPDQLIEQIDHALELPLHWRMPRLHTWWYIDAYVTQDNYMDPILLELAKLDFNIVQSIYKNELKEMSRWWRNLGIVCDKLDFARDRLVEHYLWAVGFCFEPKYWKFRKGMTKINCFITTIDDIYDVYGTLNELELFTEMINKWEFGALQSLPDYMKTCLTLLFNTVNEIANTTSTKQGVDVFPYLKRAWADLCNAYLIEARWYHTGYTPTLNEYLENAWVSISGIFPLSFSYCLSGELTEESLNSFDSYHDIVRYSCMLLRLYDDMATSEDEMQRGDVPKSIQCYMKEKNVSESVARDYIKYLIKKYWKLVNQEMTINNSINLEPFKRVITYIPRMAQCMYQHGDGHGDPNLDTRDRKLIDL
ncbi:hypothetical protein KSP40_PGU021926 [Platanthera guangdongensis]|uniref:Uncharacterized protein n=1 Tax=Platanthera guangdongensis TaxID=2320717 RepID=A0ABR2ML09_9ASPA